MVAPLLGIPLTLSILTLNQMELPAGIDVPLKFDEIDDVGHGGQGVGDGVGVGVGVGLGVWVGVGVGVGVGLPQFTLELG
jgi:hypothetical protein